MLNKNENSDGFQIPSKIRDITPPKLLAFCSRDTNKVSVTNLETKQNYASFDGVRLSNIGNMFVLNGEIV